MIDLEILKSELDRLTELRNDRSKVGALSYSKTTLPHRLLVDMISRRGGTAEDRINLMQKLRELEDR